MPDAKQRRQFYLTKRHRGGWTARAGLEYRVMKNWSAKDEYLYMDLGKKCPFVLFEAIEIGFQAHTVRAGLNNCF